ncbi:MAG: ABC transporter substrate-binding protein [Candidatus Endonucleobacter bathymodioli]|uniref:ABC transporter substrate-binding protein n=1 Tax=Candidatus Endonucleibacter bathymodioli TaxID=539814 RepID=A0AA90SSM7_9GAMM|nr:ABC transporter substrate-binding protein [Candidatus Endonucleobacter bathymodioli]
MNTKCREFINPKWIRFVVCRLLSVVLLLNTGICATIASTKDTVANKINNTMELSSSNKAKGIVDSPYEKDTLPPSPSRDVQSVTENLLKTFSNNKERYQKDNEAYLEDVDKLLSPVVAFGSIATGVMGKYSRRAKPSQAKQFEKIFKKSLIAFYGKALLKINHDDIVISQIKDVSVKLLSDYKQGKIRQIPVEMSVKANNQNLVISYAMIFIDGRWKLRNIIIDGINIGSLFRRQFIEAMDEHRNIQYVIDHWLDIMRG